MSINWLAQGIGLIAVLVFIISFQIKSNRALLVMQMLGDTLFCIQFILLGAFTGCLSLLVMVIRNIIFLCKENYSWARWKGWPWVFVLLSFVVSVYTWDGWKSILPFVAAAVGTFAYWENNAREFRTSNLFCASPCWLVYDLIVGSYAGALNEAIMIVSIVVSIIRFGWDSLGKNQFGD